VDALRGKERFSFAWDRTLVTAVAIAALVSRLGNRLIGLIEIRLGVLAALLDDRW